MFCSSSLLRVMPDIVTNKLNFKLYCFWRLIIKKLCQELRNINSIYIWKKVKYKRGSLVSLAFESSRPLTSYERNFLIQTNILSSSNHLLIQGLTLKSTYIELLLTADTNYSQDKMVIFFLSKIFIFFILWRKTNTSALKLI